MTDLLLNNGEKVLWILTTSHADGTKLAVSSPDAEFVCQKIMAIEQHIRNNGPTSSGGKHLKLVQRIETYLKRIEFLGIFGTADEQLNYVALDAFSSLKKLRLDMCPLTTVQALLNYRDQLELLHVTNTGIPDLQKAFAPIQAEYLKTLAPMILPDYTPNIPPNFLWSKLHTLRLSNCGISRIDKAMHFFPSLKFLDLSHNSISHVVHLQDCFSLRYIDLSNNRIRVLSNLERVLGRVTRMSVANNKICSLDGLDKIYSLERIDVSGNYVDDFNEIQALIRLPCLEHVRLLSNPIEKFTDYRINFFKQFLADPSVLKANRSLPTLDGRAMKKAEKKKLRLVLMQFLYRTSLLIVCTSLQTNDVYDTDGCSRRTYLCRW